MNKLIYLDTNVYLDYLEARNDNIRPLGEFAFQLIKRALACEFNIVISDLLIGQIEYNNQIKQFISLIKELENLDKITKIKTLEEDVSEAIKLRKERRISFEDALHAILAKKAEAIFIVTRNIRHFQELQDIIKPIFPENL